MTSPERTLLASVLLLITLASCQTKQPGTEFEDDRNPYFRKAGRLIREENYHAAIKEYDAALAANPSVSKAHTEMGLIYNEKLGDPVSAIYHYQKYLEERPNAADRENIQTYLEKAKLDFAITLPNSPAQNAEDIARLGTENVELKQQLAQAQVMLSKKEDEIARLRTNAGLPPSTAPVSAPPPVSLRPGEVLPPDAGPAPAATETAPSGARSHTIQQGDNLWKISRQYFPTDVNGGIEKIKQANPAQTSSERNLKIGDTLVIP